MKSRLASIPAAPPGAASPDVPVGAFVAREGEEYYRISGYYIDVVLLDLHQE